MKTIDSNKSKLKATYISILIPLAVAINLIGGQIALQLKLPLYLDAIGTVILSAIMGPWIGAISGLLSSFITSLISGNLLDTLFGLCNVATALIIGFMARGGLFKKIWHIVVATILVSFANAALGTPLGVVVYGGIQGSGVDVAVAALLAQGQDLMSARFWASFPTNLIDKGIAIVIAFIILKRLPENLKKLNMSKKQLKAEEAKAQAAVAEAAQEPTAPQA
jgi:energy-coupling factor transport system substrate-specific component